MNIIEFVGLQPPISSPRGFIIDLSHTVLWIRMSNKYLIPMH